MMKKWNLRLRLQNGNLHFSLHCCLDKQRLDGLCGLFQKAEFRNDTKILDKVKTFAFEELYANPDEHVRKLFKSMKNQLAITKIRCGKFSPDIESFKVLHSLILIRNFHMVIQLNVFVLVPFLLHSLCSLC